MGLLGTFGSSIKLRARPPERRTVASLCGQYDSWSGNGWEVNNNNWAVSSATSGSQCTYVDSDSSNSDSWHTTWTWEGAPNDIKSYAYSGNEVAKGQTISSINTMSTSASWQYNTTAIKADAAYDLLTAKDPNHADSGGDYELMIWLANYGGAIPIGSSTGTVTVDGKNWDLYSGKNGGMQIYSFVASSSMSSFSTDVKDFFNYLESNEDFPADTQNLLVFEFGTEATTGGPATFTVSSFSASVS
ncbi:hypothetical protein VTK56DRAFT_1252 [Thermocarpiscus australiensis]